MMMISQGEPGHIKNDVNAARTAIYVGSWSNTWEFADNHNNEEVETAILVWLRLQDPDLYRNESFITMCSGIVLEKDNASVQ
jgi:hypothetical protein